MIVEVKPERIYNRLEDPVISEIPLISETSHS